MDSQGLLNAEGLWNRRGALLAVGFAASAIAGFGYRFFRQIAAALGLFLILWVPLLAAALLLVLVIRAGELGYARLARAMPISSFVRSRLVTFLGWPAMLHWLQQPMGQGNLNLPKLNVPELQLAGRLDLLRRGRPRPSHHRPAA